MHRPAPFIAPWLAAAIAFASPFVLASSPVESGAAISASGAPDDGALARRVDAWFTPLAAAAEVSGTLRIERDGEPMLVRHYGFADWTRRTPHTPGTRYAAGSVTKGVLAATVVALARDGLVSLEEPIGRWLPALRGWPEMTVRAVLNHRGGLPRALPDGIDPTTTSIAAWLVAAPGRIGPAGDERYSDVGYIVLAELIEAATGQPFGDVAVKHVLRPAGMLDSRIEPPLAGVSAGDARPYAPGPLPSGVMNAPAPPPEVGSSGLVTTTADLARWVRVLADGAYPELFTGGDPLGSIDTGQDNRGRYVAVQGTLPGYVANAIRWPQHGLTVSYTGNLFSAPALDMGDTLRALVDDAPPPLPRIPPAEVPLTDAHRALVGDRQLAGLGAVRIGCDEPCVQMRLTIPGKPAHWSFHLTPIDDGALYWRAFGQRIDADPEDHPEQQAR